MRLNGVCGVVALGCGLALSCTQTSELHAQQRLHMDAIPDLALHSTVRTDFPWDPPQPCGDPASQHLLHNVPLEEQIHGAFGVDCGQRKMRLELGLGMTAFRGFGLDTDTETRSELFGQARFGLLHSAKTFVQLRSDIAAFGQWTGNEPDEPVTRRLTGRHRVRGNLSLLGTEDEAGLELELDYAIDHSGARPLYVDRVEVGPVPFVDEAATATIWPSFGSGSSDTRVAMPFSYQLRTVQYDEEGGPLPVTGLVSHQVSSGLGARAYDGEVYGWMGLLRVAWSRTEFNGVDRVLLRCASRGLLETGCGQSEDGVDVAEATLLGESGLKSEYSGAIEQIDLKLFELDSLVIHVDSDVLIVVGMFAGGSWLWDRDTNRDLAVLAWKFGTALQGEFGRLGFGVLREGTHTADGRRLISAVRLEAFVDIDPEDNSPVGLSVATATSFLTDHDLFEEDENGNKRYDYRMESSIQSRWFAKLLDDGKLGFYHTASFAPAATREDWDPWSYGEQWTHELGMFMSYDGGW